MSRLFCVCEGSLCRRFRVFSGLSMLERIQTHSRGSGIEALVLISVRQMVLTDFLILVIILLSALALV